MGMAAACEGGGDPRAEEAAAREEADVVEGEGVGANMLARSCDAVVAAGAIRVVGT